MANGGNLFLQECFFIVSTVKRNPASSQKRQETVMQENIANQPNTWQQPDPVTSNCKNYGDYRGVSA